MGKKQHVRTCVEHDKILNAVIYSMKWAQMNEQAEREGRKRYLHRKGVD